MWKQKVSASVANSYQTPTPEILKIMKNIGFEAVAPEWNNSEAFEKIMLSAKECSIEIASVHAPFDASPTFLWDENKEISAPNLKKTLRFLEDCVKFEVPVAVLHSWDKDDTSLPTEAGYENYDKIVDFATRNGLKIAFENIRRPDVFLKGLLDRYTNSNIGFCWDSGHEQCLSPNVDVLGMFGDRLFATHISDNLGVSNFYGEISASDDLHLLPFDGIADWDNQIKRLKNAQNQNILNLEIARNPHKTRYENFWHSRLTIEQYYTKVYMCACKLAAKYIK